MGRSGINILSLNIHKGFSRFNTRLILHDLREAIREVGADIVFLQEVIGENRRHARAHERWPENSQYEFLAEEVWHNHAYGKNAVYSEGHHGNAILSKFPIRAWKNYDISAHRYEQRGALHCEIELPRKGSLHALCTHLGLTAGGRRQQFARLVHLVREKIPAEAPLVFAGDFNDWLLSAPKRLAGPLGLKEAFVERTGRHARSFPAALPFLCLDRIYVRHLHVQHAELLSLGHWRHLSDHAALVATVSVP